MPQQQPSSSKSAPSRAESDSPQASADEPGSSYEKPSVKTLNQRDVLSAVKKGSKFPSRGFAG